MKAPRYATDREVLADAGESIQRFFASGVMELKEKLGPVNWQFMPSKRFERADFEAFLKLLPKSVEGRAPRHAVEVRHAEFPPPRIRVHGARVMASPSSTAADSRYPLIAEHHGAVRLCSYHGYTRGEPLGYSSASLDLWAERAKTWAAGGLPDGLDPMAQAGGARPSPRLSLRHHGNKVSNPQAAMALIERVG